MYITRAYRHMMFLHESKCTYRRQTIHNFRNQINNAKCAMPRACLCFYSEGVHVWWVFFQPTVLLTSRRLHSPRRHARRCHPQGLHWWQHLEASSVAVMCIYRSEIVLAKRLRLTRWGRGPVETLCQVLFYRVRAHRSTSTQVPPLHAAGVSNSTWRS